LPLHVPVPLTLTPLNHDDEALLCGRAAEVETIVENCRSSRLTVVTSSSGLGASSLLRAGAEPALRRDGFVTVVYSDWQGRSIATRLREAIVRAVHEQADGAFVPTPEPLLDLLTKAQAKIGRPVAVLLDQFEDYVRCHSGTDVSDDFDAELANAVSARAGRFVIALQTPSITAFERLSQYIPNLMGYTIELPPLSPEAAKDVVRKTAAQAGIAMEDAAVDQLVTAPTVIAGAGVHPLFVKLAAERLCGAELNLASKVGRASTLLANGGADRMILESLDPVIQDLGSNHVELLFRWIPLLRSADLRRTAASEKALVDRSGKWNRFALTLLPLLVKSGLLRTIATPNGLRCELARESTTIIIHDWWLRTEAAIVARQRAQFRVRSISIAAGAIVFCYLVYWYMRLR